MNSIDLSGTVSLKAALLDIGASAAYGLYYASYQYARIDPRPNPRAAGLQRIGRAGDVLFNRLQGDPSCDEHYNGYILPEWIAGGGFKVWLPGCNPATGKTDYSW